MIAEEERKEMDDGKERLWQSFLALLVGDLLGPEIAGLIGTYSFKGHPLESDNRVIQVTLLEYEKTMFLISDCVYYYLEENEHHLADYELYSLLKAADGIRDLFWSTVCKNHPEVRGKNYGVFDGFVVATMKFKSAPQQFVIGLGKFPPMR